jgi:hypothetical protein
LGPKGLQKILLSYAFSEVINLVHRPESGPEDFIKKKKKKKKEKQKQSGAHALKQ